MSFVSSWLPTRRTSGAEVEAQGTINGHDGGQPSLRPDPAASSATQGRPVMPDQASSPAIDPLPLQDVERDDAGPAMGIPLAGAILGFSTGFYQAAKRAGLVFMAENAHRRPDTVQGWYFYNKTKNYRVVLAAAKGGMRSGARMGLWTFTFVALEAGISRLRHGQGLAMATASEQAAASEGTAQGADAARIKAQRTPDQETAWGGRWVDGAGAGLGVAAGASVIYRLPGPVARRALVFGTATGMAVGALRDAQTAVAKKQVERQSKEQEVEQSKSIEKPT